MVGQFALHIQCPWRIVTSEGIVTGSPDRGCPADEDLNWTEWEKDQSTPSRQEKRLLDLFLGYDPDTGACENITDKLVVEAVSADKYGGADQLTDGYALQLFPAATGGLIPSTGDCSSRVVRQIIWSSRRLE
jgi:hypothetical protein